MRNKKVGCLGIIFIIFCLIGFGSCIAENIKSRNAGSYEYVEQMPELPDTEYADGEISGLLCSEEYSAAGEDEKHDLAARMLDSLYEQGEISAPADYYEGSDMFTFKYANGMLGGISFSEDWDRANSGSSKKSGPPASVVTGEQASAVIYNAFGSYAQEHYAEVAQSWAKKGMGTHVDNNVTIKDLKYMDQYNVIVLSMHGKMYGDVPIIKTDDRATKTQDYEYMVELCLDNTVAKIYPADGSEPYYGVLPKFFTEYFSDDAFDGAVIFSEACEFFGANPYDKNYYFADAFSTKSAEAVLGFYNSVYSGYSWDMMEKTINDIVFKGKTPNKAVQAAKKKYGKHDGYQIPEQDKYHAYLSAEGIGVDSVLFGQYVPTEEPAPTEEPTPTEEPAPTEKPAETEPPAENGFANEYDAYKALLESTKWPAYTASDAEGLSHAEYARDCLGYWLLWDIDKNGTQDLIISSGWSQANFCITAFTYADGKLSCMGSQYCGSGFAFGEPDLPGIVIKSYHGDSSVHSLLEMVEGRLRITDQMEYIGDDMDFVHHLTAGADWRELETHSLDDTSDLG